MVSSVVGCVEGVCAHTYELVPMYEHAADRGKH